MPKSETTENCFQPESARPRGSGNSRTSRRAFLATSTVGAALTPFATLAPLEATAERLSPGWQPVGKKTRLPIKVIASGNGLEATKRAYQMITNSSDVLDAVVAGVNIVEADPNDTSVGYGGLPNEQGVVQLDAACMHGPTHQAGAVACLENIKHPSQVAKRVLWRTDHVLLVGAGALEFAKAHGFTEENLLTDRAREVWLRWKEKLSDRDDWLTPEESELQQSELQNEDPDRVGDLGNDRFNQHGFIDRGEPIDALVSRIQRTRPSGTIHCAGMDADGNISCVTTTSGLAFKIPGRVGDSPIIGAGLYCDNEIGSCGSTGRGEANLHNQCSFAAVELMRGGMSPQEAGLEVLRRVAKHSASRLLNDGKPNFGLQFYLIRKDGEYAGVTMRGRGRFSITDENGSRQENLVALFD